MTEHYSTDTVQVLVVNSEHETCRMICKELTAVGYDVKICSTDLGDINFSQIVIPTILISDWQLQDNSSQDNSSQNYSSRHPSIWQQIKANPDLPPIFCLTLTPQNNFSEHMVLLEKGVDSLLSKPLNLEELRARVLAGKHILKLKQDLREQRRLLDTELAEAAAYVRSLLPNNLIEKIPITARFIPSRLLGGDCYYYYWLDPDYLTIYLLDVSGHGLGSALLSTTVLNLLRSQSLPDVNFYRPEKVLTALNETFQMNDQNEKYFTIWYGVYNRANRQLLYSSAGHPPAVLVSAPKDKPPTTECLRTSGLPVGMLPEVKYQWRRCHVPPESRLYLFSDGVYEIQQTDNTIMGLDEFIAILSEQTPEGNIDDILKQISLRVQGRSFSDDLSLLEIRLD